MSLPFLGLREALSSGTSVSENGAVSEAQFPILPYTPEAQFARRPELVEKVAGPIDGPEPGQKAQKPGLSVPEQCSEKSTKEFFNRLESSRKPSYRYYPILGNSEVQKSRGW